MNSINDKLFKILMNKAKTSKAVNWELDKIKTVNLIDVSNVTTLNRLSLNKIAVKTLLENKRHSKILIVCNGLCILYKYYGTRDNAQTIKKDLEVLLVISLTNLDNILLKQNIMNEGFIKTNTVFNKINANYSLDDKSIINAFFEHNLRVRTLVKLIKTNTNEKEREFN